MIVAMVIWKVFSRSECYNLHSCVNKLEVYQSFFSSAASFRLEIPPCDEFGVCYRNLGPTSCFANTTLVLSNLILHNEHHQKVHDTNCQQTRILFVFNHLFFELYIYIRHPSVDSVCIPEREKYQTLGGICCVVPNLPHRDTGTIAQACLFVKMWRWGHL